MRIVWYARTREIERMGPFESQVLAFKAVRLAGSPPDAPRYPPDLLVWPEEVQERPKRVEPLECSECAQIRCMCVMA